MTTEKSLGLGKLWRLKKLGLVRAVDGEKKFKQPGISHGFVHFANPETGEYVGFCGIDYFRGHRKAP